ncbi:MAG: S1C family serine protease, partial [Jatrophihabitantaceae bacterium]
ATEAVNGTAIAGGSVTRPTPTPSVPGNGNFPFPLPRSNNPGPQATASSAQQIGVVDVNTVEKYNSASAAGTGMVLSSDGDILTNNHVIDGATSVTVTVVATGKTYAATVVGTAPSRDIAVLHLVNASGLTTANLGNSDSVAVGDKVTGVGNAGGTGGAPSAAKGTVTALHRTITASDGGGSNSETLHDVIVTDAPIQSGDSGGPLYDSSDQVIGINTAASTSGRSAGFALPISKALAVADEIKRGVETSSIHIGYPGFLGITVAAAPSSGALVAGVLQGGPAASAGISAGDVITRVGSTAIATSTQLRTAVSSHNPGSQVTITYTDPNTGRHTATVTLATGPAD